MEPSFDIGGHFSIRLIWQLLECLWITFYLPTMYSNSFTSAKPVDLTPRLALQ